MSKYLSIVDQLLQSSKQSDKHANDFLHRDLLNELKLNHTPICQFECQTIANSKTIKLFEQIINSNSPQLFALLKQILQLLYLKESNMLKIVYQMLPLLLRKYIECHDSKNTEIQELVRIIFRKQQPNYSRAIKQRDELQSNPFFKDLYYIHFNRKVASQGEGHHPNLDKSIEVQDSQSMSIDRRSSKIVLLFVIYRNIEYLNDDQLKQYLKAIYIYCGGDEKTYNNVSSFYLLQKKNLFNLFRYSISEQQIEWILLTLYQLSIQQNKWRFELLAAINMIYKKTANQSMFKLSQIAQSIIHLLQDEYSQIFS